MLWWTFQCIACQTVNLKVCVQARPTYFCTRNWDSELPLCDCELSSHVLYFQYLRVSSMLRRKVDRCVILVVAGSNPCAANFLGRRGRLRSCCMFMYIDREREKEILSWRGSSMTILTLTCHANFFYINLRMSLWFIFYDEPASFCETTFLGVPQSEPSRRPFTSFSFIISTTRMFFGDEYVFRWQIRKKYE